jgi:SAM-dependent methyltransferase
VGTATAIPFIGSKFDSVVAVSLIEHLDVNEGHLFIEEAFRVLRPGGVIFLVTPNFRSPLRYVQGDHWFGFSDKTHVTFYTPNHMRRLLAAHGFDGVRFAFRVNTAELEWPLPRFFYRLPARIRLFLNYVLASTPLGQFRDSFWVAARKPL